MYSHSFVRFNFLISLSLFFLLSLPLHAMNEDGEEGEVRRTPASLIEPLTLTLETLNRPLGEEGRLSLIQKAQRLQDLLPDTAVDALMILGSQYVQNIKTPSAEAEEGIPPSLHETLGVLDSLAQIEQDFPPDQPNLRHFCSSFSYSRLERYVPECSFANQRYYLHLFQTLFRETDFNTNLSDLMIEWSLNFMRPNHSENTCTEISALIRTYITDHLDENHRLSPLAEQFLLDADEDQGDWEDEEVIDLMNLYLNEGEEQDINLDDNGTEIIQE